MLDEIVRNQIVMLGHQAHALTESAYRDHPSRRGDPGWAGKQRILLADMALHLLQTALREGELAPAELRRNLFAILTVADQFSPDDGLKASAERLLAR